MNPGTLWVLTILFALFIVAILCKVKWNFQDSAGTDSDVVGTGVLMVCFLSAQLGILVLLHTAFSLADMAHLVGERPALHAGDGLYFPSYPHVRMVFISVVGGGLAAGIAYYDFKRPQLAAWLAACVPVPLILIYGWEHAGQPLMTGFIVGIMVLQFFITSWWSKSLADRWKPVPNLAHYY